MKEKKSVLLFLALLPIIFFSAVLGDNQGRAADSAKQAKKEPDARPIIITATPESEILPTPEPTSAPIDIPVVSRATLQPLNTTMQQPDTSLSVNHFVAEDETLTAIAGQYGVTIDAIHQANNLIDPHSLFIGQQLVIPVSALQARQYQSLEVATADNPTRAKTYTRTQIGTSANGYAIESYVIGDGRYHVAVIGAMHGGYEWNTALLAFRLLAYFTSFPERLPDGITLHIIPVANPDGTVAVTGLEGPFTAGHISGDTTIGRFNGNGVDLNRNWDCGWAESGVWRETMVSGGDKPFSEPETFALRAYIMDGPMDGELSTVVWLHSAAGLVIPGSCGEPIHGLSLNAANLFGQAAGYPVGGFTAYEVTGDAANWLAMKGIASFTVELTDHEQIEFDRNLSGLLSLLNNIETIKE